MNSQCRNCGKPNQMHDDQYCWKCCVKRGWIRVIGNIVLPIVDTSGMYPKLDSPIQYAGEELAEKREARINAGLELRRLRLDGEYTQDEVGAMFGVSRFLISKWECGATKTPDHVLEQLAENVK